MGILEGGQIELHKENINLNELLGDIVAKFQLMANQKNIHFVFYYRILWNSERYNNEKLHEGCESFQCHCINIFLWNC